MPAVTLKVSPSAAELRAAINENLLARGTYLAKLPVKRMPPRVSFITNCWDHWGGSEELWAGAAAQLRAEDFAVLAIRAQVTTPGLGGAARLAQAGVQVRDFRWPFWRYVLRRLVVRLRAKFPFLRHFVRYEPIARALKAFRPDLAVISQGETFDGILGQMDLAQICADLRLPYVLVCQRSSEDVWPGDGVRESVRRAFTGARRVYFVSEHNRRLTQTQLGLPLPQAEVIRNPFMVKTAGPLPWPRAGDGILRLACVSRIYLRDKGQDLLLGVLARESWRQRKIEVHFFGRGDNDIALGEMAKMLDVPNVRFRGFADDVTDVWRQFHAIILPSRREGLPLALVEAMMCGRFGIVTDVGGTAEVVTDNVSGFVAAAPTVDALDEAMQRAWRRKDEWEQIGQAAAREIRRRVPEDPCGVFAEKISAVQEELRRLKRSA